MFRNRAILFETLARSIEVILAAMSLTGAFLVLVSVQSWPTGMLSHLELASGLAALLLFAALLLGGMEPRRAARCEALTNDT